MLQSKSEDELKKIHEKIAKTQQQLENNLPLYEAQKQREENCTQQ